MTQPPENPFTPPSEPGLPGNDPYGQPPIDPNNMGQAPYGQAPHQGVPQDQAYGQPYGQPYGQQSYGYGQPVQQEYPRAAQLTLGALLACAVVAIGAFLPWVTFGSLSANGVSDNKDGVITLTLAVITAIVAVIAVVVRKRGILLASGIVSVVMGALLSLTAIIDIADVSDSAADVGIGLILTGIFAVVLLAVGILQIIACRRK